MKNYFLIFVVLIIKLTYLNTAYADKISILYKVENSPITNKDIAKEINYLSLFNKELKNIDEEQLITNLQGLQSIEEEQINPNDYDIEQLLTVQTEDNKCSTDEFKFSFE